MEEIILTDFIDEIQLSPGLAGVAVVGDGGAVEDGVAGVQLLDGGRRKCLATLSAADLDAGGWLRTRWRRRRFRCRRFLSSGALNGVSLNRWFRDKPRKKSDRFKSESRLRLSVKYHCS